MANERQCPVPGGRPGRTLCFEFEGETLEIDTWLVSPSAGPPIFPPESELKHPPVSIGNLNEPLNNPSEPKDEE